MKKAPPILSLCVLVCWLLGCGAPAEAPSATVTTAPTETQSAYPTPDKRIALTFDDGPNRHMGAIIDVLAQYDAKATFFIIGNRTTADTSRYILQAFQAGHELGNHSYSHEDMTVKTNDEVLADILQCQTVVQDITGTAPRWFRAPFLRTSDTLYSLVEMPFAGCSVNAGDGTNENLAADRHYKVVNGAHDGAIVLLHCNDITAGVLPQILHDLKLAGYELVTITELFGGNPPAPSQTYKQNGTN